MIGAHMKENATRHKPPQKLLILKSIKIFEYKTHYMRLRCKVVAVNRQLANNCEYAIINVPSNMANIAVNE